MPSGTEVGGRELLNMTYSFPAQVSGRLVVANLLRFKS